MHQFTTNEVTFRFLLQPIIEIESTNVIGYECLSDVSVLTSHSKKDDFFESISKETIKSLILSQIKSINSLISIPEFFSVNIPASLIIDLSFIKSALSLANFNLAFEITEFDISKSQLPFLRNMMRFAKRCSGVKFWLDDFIPNNNLIELINYLPLDVIKFDKSVIRSQGLLSTSLSACEKAGISCDRIIIEGVENKQQRQSLNGFNCAIQGYYYAYPEPMDNFN